MLFNNILIFSRAVGKGKRILGVMIRSVVKLKIAPPNPIVSLFFAYISVFFGSIVLFIISPSNQKVTGLNLVELAFIIAPVCFILFVQLPSVKNRNLALYRVGLLSISPSLIALLANVDWTLSKMNPHNFNVALTKLDSFYLTITTMATVGYGDIYPKSELARICVSAQIIIGVAFIAFIIQREITTVRHKKPT